MTIEREFWPETVEIHIVPGRTMGKTCSYAKGLLINPGELTLITPKKREIPGYQSNTSLVKGRAGYNIFFK